MTDNVSPNNLKPIKPRGFPDITKQTLQRQSQLIAAVTRVYKQWGFQALETGAFEYASCLGQFLPDDDRPNAGVFSIEDDDEQWMSLRYDLTAPLARYYASNRQNLPNPYRRFAAGPVWRNEKPDVGRYREFLQCDADSVGTPGFHADAEMVAMGAEAMRAVGARENEFAIRVNTRRLLNAVLSKVGANNKKARLSILRALDKLDRLGVDAVADLLGKGRLDESGDFTEGAGLESSSAKIVLDFATARKSTRESTLDALSAMVGETEEGRNGLNELTSISSALTAMQASENDVVFDPSIVRGLAYYTGPVYEIELLSNDKNAVQRVGSVGGGGRYDDLIARFKGESVPAVGISIGISRLAIALNQSESDSYRDGPVIVLNLNRSDPSESLILATQLKKAGVEAEAYMGGSGMRPQLKYADRRNSPVAVMVGDDEIAKGVVTIKDLKLGSELAKSVESNEEYRSQRLGQFEVARNDFVAAVKSIVERK